METVVLQLDQAILDRAKVRAAREGTTVDTVVNHALDRYTAQPGEGLADFLRRATAEGWRRPGPAMTDAEMYGR